jgi:hypothetical protein
LGHSNLLDDAVGDGIYRRRGTRIVVRGVLDQVGVGHRAVSGVSTTSVSYGASAGKIPRSMRNSCVTTLAKD